MAIIKEETYEHDKENSGDIGEFGFLHILYGGYSVLDATVLLYFVQDTFGLYGTGVEGWRPDIGQ